MTVPYTFANQSGNIPLAELDTNFANVKAAADTAGVVTASAQPNITSVGTLTTLSVSGNVVAGNVTANNFIGNIVGNISNAVYATTAGLAASANIVALAAQTNITSVGILTGLSVSGNTNSGNLRTAGTVSATGNITGNFILGNGSQLTGITANYSNSNVASYLPTYSGNISGGNVSVTGAISAAGNIKGANVIGTSFYAAGIVSVSGNVDAQQFHGSVFGNNVVSNLTITNNDHFQFNVGNVANVIYINDGGMIVDGGINGFISAAGNIIGANINASNDIQGGNIITGGKVSAVGVIFGANAVITDAVNANRIGANIFTGGTISMGGNIESNTWVTARYMGCEGNVRIYNGNLLVQNGYISAVGNVSANGIVKTGVFTTGTLPSAATAGAGARALVTDANSTTFGNLYVGSSGNTIPVWSNGSNWYIG